MTDANAPVALFDMDGSLANYDLAMRRSLIALRAPCEPAIDAEADLHALEDGNHHVKARIDLIKSVPGWWRSLPRIESGFEVVRMAREIGFAINILTKGPGKHSNAWMEKLDWCRDQPELQDADIHMTMNKALTFGVMLFDDYPPYCEAWLKHRPRGLVVMPETPYNQNFSHPNLVRWDPSNPRSERRTFEAMHAAFSRPPGSPLNV